jgi:hypothetical protein
MRANGLIRGDTDAPTSLSDLQHGATIQLAAIGVQDELNELTADNLIAYEHNQTGSISTVAGTRSYSLPSGFIRFFGTPSLYDASSNVMLYEFSGGEQSLQQQFTDYKTAQARPQSWYFDLTTTKKIAFWPVPQSVITYTFDFEQDVSVTAASDTLPFHNEQEAQAFCRLASRRFKMLYEGMDVTLIQVDPERNAAKATLFQIMRGKNPVPQYAPVYR